MTIQGNVEFWMTTKYLRTTYMIIQGNVEFWITTKHLGSKHHMFTCSLTSNTFFYASIKILLCTKKNESLKRTEILNVMKLPAR